MMVKNVDGARWLPGFRPGSRHTRRAMAGAALQPPRSRRGMPDPPESMGRQTTRLASRADGGRVLEGVPPYLLPVAVPPGVFAPPATTGCLPIPLPLMAGSSAAAGRLLHAARARLGLASV